MSKQRTQSSESQHQSTTSQQAPQGPVTEDAGVAHAEHVGNGAMQEEMQGQGQEEGQSEAEGAFDWVVDKGKEAVDDIWASVEEWGLEQLDSVQAILTYVDTVGIEVAMPLLVQVGSDLVNDLMAHLATLSDQRDLLWALLDWMRTVASFVGDLTPEQLARLVGEGLRHNAEWLLAEVAALDSEVLLAFVQLLDGATLEELVTLRNQLSVAIVDAVWPAGVGIELSAGGSMAIAFFAVGANYAGTLRHLGGGRLEGSFEVSGSAGLETGLGEKAKAGPKEEAAMATLYCGADGVVSVSLAAADLGTWDGFTLIGAVAGGLGLAQVIDTMLASQAIDVAEMITAMEVSGEVSAGAQGELAGGDLLGAAADLGQKIGAGAVRCSNMKGEGDRFTAATVELEFSSGAYAKVAGTHAAFQPGSEEEGGTLALPLPQLEGELSGETGVRVRTDIDLEALTVGDVELEVFVKGSAAGIDAEAALQGECMDAYTVDGFLDSFEALKVALSFELNDVAARAMLQDSPLYALAEPTGLAVIGTMNLKATLDRDTARFIAEAVAGAAHDESAALDRLKAWAANPLGPELGDAKTLLCMELAQAANLEAKLESKIEILAEAGFEAAEGLKLGMELMVGAKADFETDLLAQGMAPTTSNFDDIISRLGSAAQAEALAAK